MLNYSDAKFAMAIRDVWTEHDGGPVSFNSFKRGHVYPILDSEIRGGTRCVVTDSARYFLPIGYFDRGSNEFNKDFILVDSLDSVVEPYSSILKLEENISSIRKRYSEEMKPICERRDNELKPIEAELHILEDKLKLSK